jgi:hypothetical protein
LSPKSEYCRDLDFGEKPVKTKSKKPVTENKTCNRINSPPQGTIALLNQGRARKKTVTKLNMWDDEAAKWLTESLP